MDREVEAWLGPLVAGSVVIGEEAARINPGQLAQLSTAHWAWLIDPIDGTRGFVDGTDHFGVMIALLERGQTRAAWISMDVPTRPHQRGSGDGLRGDRARERAGPAMASRVTPGTAFGFVAAYE